MVEEFPLRLLTFEALERMLCMCAGTVFILVTADNNGRPNDNVLIEVGLIGSTGEICGRAAVDPGGPALYPAEWAAHELRYVQMAVYTFCLILMPSAVSKTSRRRRTRKLRKRKPAQEHP
jgi:hypothetical protein